MFLRRIAARATRMRDDSGSVLVAVIGVSAVGLIIATVILSSVTHSLAFSSETRAGVQSQASADAGIAVAQAGLLNGTCLANGGVYKSAPGAVPEYRTEVRIQNAAGDWVLGCPATDLTSYKLLADGDASAVGILGHSGRDTSTVEAHYESPVPPTTVIASGAAVYAHSSSGFGNSGTIIQKVGGGEPDVHIRTGNFTCENSSSGAHNLVVANGNLSISNSCNFNGSVWASGNISMTNSATIPGDVIGANVSMSNSAKVIGNVWTPGTLDMGNSSSIGGKYSASSKTGSSSATPFTAPVLPAPPMPTVPDWIDYDFNHAEDWNTFAVATLTAGDCDYSDLKAAVDAFGSSPGVVDARTCEIELTNTERITVRADLAIFTKEFKGTNSSGFNKGGEARLWIITPDAVADNLPSCPAGGGGISVSNSFQFHPDIPTILYSPCTVSLSNSMSITGQIYAGKVDLTNSTALTFVAVGLPGEDLANGPAPVGPGPVVTPPERKMVSMRNLSGG